MFLPFHGFELFWGMALDNICVAVIVLTTVYSGVEYFIQNKQALEF